MALDDTARAIRLQGQAIHVVRLSVSPVPTSLCGVWQHQNSREWGHISSLQREAVDYRLLIFISF
jgi:hypothetical protein